MFLTNNHLNQMTPSIKILLSVVAAACLFGGISFAKTTPLEPFSPGSGIPLSDALESYQSGILASSAPNPGAAYSMGAIAGQALLFNLGASGPGRFRARIEDPDGDLLEEVSLGDGESKQINFIAEKTGRFVAVLQPLTVEVVEYGFSARLNVVPDEEGNDSIMNAQVLDQGFIPTGFHDRAVTLRSDSDERTEVFQIDLAAGESLSLATDDRRVEFEIKNGLGTTLASSTSGVDGLRALIAGYSVASNQSLFVEVLNARERSYDFVATISSPAEEYVPPSTGPLSFDESRPFSNIRQAELEGVLWNADGFSRDTYRMNFRKNQTVGLLLSMEGSGPVSYLLESPGRVPLRTGEVGVQTNLSLTAEVAGDYFLTISTTDVTLNPYSVELVSNILVEPPVVNDLAEFAYPIAYGWTEVGGCTRILTLSGEVGLGNDRFDLEPNNSIGQAQDLELGEWSLELSHDILDSTAIPHTSLRGDGDGTKDLYRIVSRVPGSRLICDIDRTFSLDTFLRVLDDDGNLVFENNNSETNDGGGGSRSKNDSFIDAVLENPGTYFIEVGRNGGDGNLANNDRYELHVSLENHRLQNVAESDPHDYYRIDLAEGELLTLALYQDDPFLEVFENGNPVPVEFFSRFDLPQMLTYRADSDTSLEVKLSNELVVPYDLLMVLNAGIESQFHSTPAMAMSVDVGESLLAWIADDLPDFYRVSFAEDDSRTVSILQNDQQSPLKIEVYNLNQERVASAETSLVIPGELGDEFYVAIRREEEVSAFYLLQVGDAATDCRDVFPMGSFAVEWQVVPAQSYQVEYSSNLLDWTLIPELVSSPTSMLQWIDTGPPRTNSAPGVDRGNRYYRLVTPGE